MGQFSNTDAKAYKEIEVLAMPSIVIPDAFAGAILVKKGNLCRIEGTAGGFVVFGDVNVAVPDANTKTALKTEAGFFIVAATAGYIRTSVAMRIEVIKD